MTFSDKVIIISIMKQHAPIHAEDLERRGLHLTIFACLAIFVLAVGVAVLMYQAVFSPGTSPTVVSPKTAFYGFCILSVLLVGYIWDRQSTIVKLRNQIEGDRKKATVAWELASRELLKTLPNFSSFQDRLPMEYRRAANTQQELSILLIQIQLHEDFSAPSAAQSTLGDAAKAIARKLRDEDSIYLLQFCYFAIVLPGVKLSAARGVSVRVAEGLTDVAGAIERYSFKIDIINYPLNASTAIELESCVCALIPDENSQQQLISTEIAT